MPRYALVYRDRDCDYPDVQFVHADDFASARVMAKRILLGDPANIETWGNDPDNIGVDPDSNALLQEDATLTDTYIVQLQIELPISEWQAERQIECDQKRELYREELIRRQENVDRQLPAATDDRLHESGFIKWLRTKRPDLFTAFLEENDIERDPSISP